MEASPAETTNSPEWFKTTRWTIVLNASRSESPGTETALAELCRAYWLPLYTFVRRSGYKPEDAQDLTQGFFARLLEKEFLKNADPEKGRFRSFLLVALKRFLANERDRANCIKRGGGLPLISLDTTESENRYRAEPVDGMTPERAFERRWALTVLDQVMSRLEAEFVAGGKVELFGELKGFLSGDQDRSYVEVAQRVALSEGALRVSVHRLRQRYRELLRCEIAQTVGTREEVDDEIRNLFASLA